MRNSISTFGLLVSAGLFFSSCMKVVPAASSQETYTSANSLIVAPSPQPNCYPTKGYLTSIQGAPLHANLFNNYVDNYPSWGLESNLDVTTHNVTEVFPAENVGSVAYYILHLRPSPTSGHTAFWLGSSNIGAGSIAFNSAGQITSLAYDNASIKSFYEAAEIGDYVEFPDLTFHYAPDYKLTSIDRHWPDGSYPDDYQIFTYDDNGNISKMVTLRKRMGVLDPGHSSLTVTFTYGAATTSRQLYTWLSGGGYHNSVPMTMVQLFGWVSSMRPKNLLTRVDRYESTGYGASHFVDIISNHQFTNGKLTQFTDNRTSPDAPGVHISFKYNMDWFCDGPYTVNR